MNRRISGARLFPEDLGFMDSVSAHAGRTIMLKELTLLLNITSRDIQFDDLQKRIYNDNILQKSSISGRKESFYRLRQSYGLDIQTPVFRALRFLWDFDSKERPMLALQCALARDTILVLISMKIGDLVAAYKYANDLARYAGGATQAQATELAGQIKARVEMGAQELPDELLRKAEVIVHQVRVR